MRRWAHCAASSVPSNSADFGDKPVAQFCRCLVVKQSRRRISGPDVRTVWHVSRSTIIASIQPASAVFDPSLRLPCLAGGRRKIGCVHVIFTGDPDQGEESIPCDAADVSATGQTGQSEAIHSPEACASIMVRLIIPATEYVVVVPPPQFRPARASCARCRVRSTRVRTETSARRRPPIGWLRQRFLWIEQARPGLGQSRRKLCDRLAQIAA